METMKVEMQYDEERGLYLAVAPELHFCTGLGRTPEEARARLELAVSLWFDRDGEGSPVEGESFAPALLSSDRIES